MYFWERIVFAFIWYIWWNMNASKTLKALKWLFWSWFLELLRCILWKMFLQFCVGRYFMHSGNPEIVYFRKYQRIPDDEEKKIMNKCIQTMLQSYYISIVTKIYTVVWALSIVLFFTRKHYQNITYFSSMYKPT